MPIFDKDDDRVDIALKIGAMICLAFIVLYAGCLISPLGEALGIIGYALGVIVTLLVAFACCLTYYRLFVAY